MPKPTRSSRSRTRTRRAVSAPPAPIPTVAEAAGTPVGTPLPAAPVAAPRRISRTPAGLSAAISQRSFTDHAYIISELKRIFVISGGIVLLMVVLWFFVR